MHDADGHLGFGKAGQMIDRALIDNPGKGILIHPEIRQGRPEALHGPAPQIQNRVDTGKAPTLFGFFTAQLSIIKPPGSAREEPVFSNTHD